MSYDYDELYEKTPDALGEPTQVFVDFFQKCKHPKLRVLDVGCGQGRDALFIARLGHNVVGLDISPNGIRDLVAAARRENLRIEGVVADITSFALDGIFDVILIDRTLHMLSEPQRLAALDRLADHVAPDGRILIADERSNILGMKQVLSLRSEEWHIEHEKDGYLFVCRS